LRGKGLAFRAITNIFIYTYYNYYNYYNNYYNN